jgi:transposase
MADLAQGLLRKKVPALRGALEGRIEEHHRFLLRLQLERLDRVDADLAQVDAYVDTKLEPYREQQRALEEIPGVGALNAAAIIAEIGVDMTAFRSEHHLAAWAGVCPGNNETAGKKRSEHARKGNVHLRTTLVEAAQAGVRKRGSYFRGKYYRLKARQGGKRAVMAIAHKIVLVAYQLLAKGCAYKELGEGYLDALSQQRIARQLVRRLEDLGYSVRLDAAQGPP